MDEGGTAVNETDGDDEVDKEESSRKDAVENTSENPTQPETTFDDVRRQGGLNPDFSEKQNNPSRGSFDGPKPEVSRAQHLQYGLRSQTFDVSNEDEPADQSTHYRPRPRNPKKTNHDGAPVLQLMEGGYQRPYGLSPGIRNQAMPRADSSEQSEEVRKLEKNRNNNRQISEQRIVPQVLYATPGETSYPFGPGPVLRSPFQVPQRMIVNRNPTMRILPTAVQHGFLNTPPAGFTDYTTTAFQAPFPFTNDLAGFSAYANDPNNGAIYHTRQRIPFQSLYQVPPATPVLVNSPRNLQSQFPSSYPTYINLENIEERPRQNLRPYSRPSRPQYQSSPDFFGENPVQEGNSFNNQPLNYPNAIERLPTQFYRNPVVEGGRYQDVQSGQQPALDASEENKKPKEMQMKDSNSQNNQPRFGNRLQRQNDGDVYIRYPTNHAGYAIEETLPSQNLTKKVAENIQEADPQQRSLTDRDPYINTLNAIRNHRRPNNSYPSPPEGPFRGPLIDFGYQRPQAQPLLDYPDRNRDLPSFLSSPNFDSRSSFNQIPSFPQDPFENASNQRRTNREYDETQTPSCAKSTNASICFEDSEYPR